MSSNRELCGTCYTPYNNKGVCECNLIPKYKHKHYDIAIAYLNGKDIETYLGPKLGWCLIDNIKDSQDIPCFPSSIEYRIKK